MVADTKLTGILLHGVAGSRPSASAVAGGTLYFATDTGVISQSDGASIWTTFLTVPAAASGSITSSGYTQNTAKMLGRTTSSSGAIEEITVGSGLSLSAGALTATGTTGITRSTLGYTSVGASFEGNRGWYVKKVTLATDGYLASIVAHVKGAAGSARISPILVSDSSGSPINIINGPLPSLSATPVDLHNVDMNTTARWVTLAVGAWLTAADYWIGVGIGAGAGNGWMNLAYDTGGSDQVNATAGDIAKDSSRSSYSNTTHNHSIYANVLR